MGNTQGLTKEDKKKITKGSKSTQVVELQWRTTLERKKTHLSMPKTTTFSIYKISPSRSDDG
jgi:hypothetical protein